MDLEVPCDPPRQAEVGDVWYCPGCARRFHYVEFEDEDGTRLEVWYTDEV